MMYNNLVTTYFFNPEHVGSLELSPNCICIRQQSSVKGCYYDLYLSLNAEGKIDKACFKAAGNPFLIAGLEYVCRALEGSKLSEHPCVSYMQLVQIMDLPRNHYPIAILIEEGYRKALMSLKAGSKK